MTTFEPICSIVYRGNVIHQITQRDALECILTDDALDSGFYPFEGLYLIECEDGRWTAIDNSENNALCEDFDTLQEAKKWLTL